MTKKSRGVNPLNFKKPTYLKVRSDRVRLSRAETYLPLNFAVNMRVIFFWRGSQKGLPKRNLGLSQQGGGSKNAWDLPSPQARTHLPTPSRGGSVATPQAKAWGSLSFLEKCRARCQPHSELLGKNNATEAKSKAPVEKGEKQGAKKG